MKHETYNRLSGVLTSMTEDCERLFGDGDVTPAEAAVIVTVRRILHSLKMSLSVLVGDSEISSASSVREPAAELAEV